MRLPTEQPPAKNYCNEPIRQKIQDDVSAYLARGGKITVCGPEENQGWRFCANLPIAELRDKMRREAWEIRMAKRGLEASSTRRR
jgi:hypothetical protein